MLIFKIRERISIDVGSLLFNLHKTKIRIDLNEIKEISFNDCFNEIKIKTICSSVTLNMKQFHSKKVETFFTENGLYQPEIMDSTEYNQ